MIKKKILELLKLIKIKKNDVIMIHGDISLFGQFDHSSTKRNINFFFNQLNKRVGNKGAVLSPCFTYSFCKNKIFNYEKSPSEVGNFSEIFRNRNDTKRTKHPIFSFSIYPKKNPFIKTDNSTCFGKSSLFEKFHSLNGKIICFGVSPEKSITFFHYLEELCNVNYRKNKEFKGKIIIKNKTSKIKTNYFVRKIFKNTDFKMNQSLKKIINKNIFGRYFVYSIDSNKLFDSCVKRLKINQNYLIDG